MKHNRAFPLVVGPALLCATSCADEVPPDPGSNSPTVTIIVAPLDSSPLGVVCYDLEVATQNGTLWRKGDPEIDRDAGDDDSVCSNEHGNGTGGSITWVGACDATTAADTSASTAAVQNAVSLWFDGVYTLAGGVYTARSGWYDPCGSVGCTLHFDCIANTDTLAQFDFTIIRDAEQGFFDIAIRFQNIYCSAKLDTCYGDAAASAHVEQVFGADGKPDWSAVLGLTCVGPAGTPIDLHYSQIAVQCNGTTFLIDATKAQNAEATSGDHTLRYTVSRSQTTPPCDDAGTPGVETCRGLSWNIALSLEDLAPLGACTLTASATATNGNTVFADGLPADPGVTYPYIDFSAPLTTLAGPFCQMNPLNGDGSHVTTAYHGPFTTPPVPMCFTLDQDNVASVGFNGVHASCGVAPPGLPPGKYLKAFTKACNIAAADEALGWSARAATEPITCGTGERCIPGGADGYGYCAPNGARLCSGEADDNCSQAIVQLVLTRPEAIEAPAAPSLPVTTIPKDDLLFGTVGDTGAVGTVSVTAGGEGYAVDQELILPTGDANAKVKIKTVSQTGPIVAVSVPAVAEGSGYVVDDVLTISGGGEDATIKITGVTTSGPVLTAHVSDAGGGSGYVVDDVLTITSGNGNATVKVESIDDAGGVLMISVVSGGSGYSPGTGFATIGGSGSGCMIDVDTVAPGTPNGVTLVNKGTGYAVANGQATTGGTGTGFQIDVIDVDEVNAVLTIEVVAGGSGYVPGPATATWPAGTSAGTGCKVAVATIRGVGPGTPGEQWFTAIEDFDFASGEASVSIAARSFYDGISGGFAGNVAAGTIVHTYAMTTAASYTGWTVTNPAAATGGSYQVLYCEKGGGATAHIGAGVCIPTGSAASCDPYSTNFTCPEGTYCDGGPSFQMRGKCRERAGEDVPCSPSLAAIQPWTEPCRDGLECAPNADVTEWACREPGGEGAPCEASLPYKQCAPDLYCRPQGATFATCAPRDGLGARCAPDLPPGAAAYGDHTNSCQQGLICAPSDYADSTKPYYCVDPAPGKDDGEPCWTTSSDIRSAFRCKGHCEPYAFMGLIPPGPLDNDGVCRSDYRIGERCLAESTAGDPFDFGGFCRADLYCSTSAVPPGTTATFGYGYVGTCRPMLEIGCWCDPDQDRTEGMGDGFCPTGQVCDSEYPLLRVEYDVGYCVPAGCGNRVVEYGTQVTSDWRSLAVGLTGLKTATDTVILTDDVAFLTAHFPVGQLVKVMFVTGLPGEVPKWESRSLQSLSADLTGLIATLAQLYFLTEIPPWSTWATYQRHDVVNHEGLYFYATDAMPMGSMGPGMAGSLWKLMPFGQLAGPWASPNAYVAYDVVSHAGAYYYTDVAVPVDGAAPGAAGSPWKPMPAAIGNDRGPWSAASSYTPYDVVSHLDRWYRARAFVVSGGPPPDESLLWKRLTHGRVVLGGTYPTMPNGSVFAFPMVPASYEECDDGVYNCDDIIAGRYACTCSSSCMYNPTPPTE